MCPHRPVCPAARAHRHQSGRTTSIRFIDPMGNSTAKPPQAAPGECPVPAEYRNPAVYNVYGQRINDPASSSSKNPITALQNTQILDPRSGESCSTSGPSFCNEHACAHAGTTCPWSRTSCLVRDRGSRCQPRESKATFQRAERIPRGNSRRHRWASTVRKPDTCR